MFGRIALGFLLVFVLIAGVAGIGGYAYNMGLTQGLASGAKLEVAPTQGVAPVPFYGYGAPFMHRSFGGGWGFLSCLVPLFVFFVFFSVMRMVFWRARWGGMHGMHHRKWEGGVPPMAEEWHKKMHEADQAGKQESK